MIARAFLILAVLLAACGDSEPVPPPAAPAPKEAAAEPTPAAGPIPVRISIFSWPGYAFWFVAKEKGLAPELDLQIKIIEDPYESFGLMLGDQLDAMSSTVEYGPIGAEAGHPARIVALANTTYGSDKIIVGPKIEKPADLKGKKVAVLEGGLSQIYMGIFLERSGLAFNDVTYVNLVSDDAAAAMVSGDVAGGEFWEPYGGQVLKNLPGSRIIDQTWDPYWGQSGLISDAVFMSKRFIDKDPELAAKVLKAYYAGVAYWMKNPKEANDIIAKALQFPLADVVAVIGEDGHFVKGGLWVYSLDEAAAFMGVGPGDPPLGQKNGGIDGLYALLNEWWLKFGLIKKEQPIEAGVEKSVLKRVVELGS
ncbi:MAG TPA: ABC transporter substrate-binding protein [Myxococcota bacterium]|nr:ABC transporter substrate-binding protein [Myxococcota bacterium]